MMNDKSDRTKELREIFSVVELVANFSVNLDIHLLLLLIVSKTL